MRAWTSVGLVVGLVAVTAAMVVEILRTPPDLGRVVIAVSVFDNETGSAEFDRPVAGLSDLVVARLTNLAPEFHFSALSTRALQQ